MNIDAATARGLRLQSALTDDDVEMRCTSARALALVSHLRPHAVSVIDCHGAWDVMGEDWRVFLLCRD